MLSCFKEGFVYVFSKEKFLENGGRRNYICSHYTRFWVDESDGKIIEVFNSRKGFIENTDGYGAIPEWCIEKETSGSAKPTCHKAKLYENANTSPIYDMQFHVRM